MTDPERPRWPLTGWWTTALLAGALLALVAGALMMIDYLVP